MKNIPFSAFVLMALLFTMSAAGAQSQPDFTPPGTGDVPQPDERHITQNPPAGNSVAPQMLSLPAGTLVVVRTAQYLSSDSNRPGDRFAAILDQPIVAQGWVVARRGQNAIGNVAVAQRADRNRDNSQLALELYELVLVDGRQLPIRTELIQVSDGKGRSWTPDKTATIGATTGTGAFIGAVAGHGEGAAIGAVAGAIAGIAGIMSMRGRPTEIFPEAILTFRIDQPATISTGRSQQAFLPVTQDDYSRRAIRNPDRYPTADSYPPPPPPPAYYAPYDSGWYPYPYYYLGAYRYSFPRHYSGIRVLIRPSPYGRR
jgi:hypothetical protein